MRVFTLFASAASVAAAAAAGSLATRPSVGSKWYAVLRKPVYQPAPQVFSVVWPALYADIALVSASTVDQLSGEHETRRRRAYAAALGVNLILNAGWSWLFFNRHQLGASAAVAAVLTASSADLARRAISVRGPRGLPLVAYPLWCAFATALSTHIWWLNCARHGRSPRPSCAPARRRGA